MIAFEISRNGKVLAVAGARDLIGLNVNLSAHGDLSARSEDMYLVSMLALGVATGDEEKSIMHTWNLDSEDERFQVGDTITIRIVETDDVSPPTASEEVENEEEDEGDEDF